MVESRLMYSRPYGVAFSGPGKHPRKLDYPAHAIWLHVLQRCYCTDTKKRQPTYKDCTMCEEWLDYQTFADWFVSQRGHDLGWQIDKDLLSSRLDLPNKIYSPETCILLPEYVNKTLTIKQNKPSGLPIGVFHNTKKTAFVARYRNEKGINTHIGTYSSIKEAADAYKVKKQEVLTFLADKYKNLLDIKAYNILSTYY